MPDLEKLWSETYYRVHAVTARMTAEEAERTVPATSDWTIRQLLSHMVGVDKDALDGEVPEDLNPSWTEHHVDDRKDKTVEQILAEWVELKPRVEEALRTQPAEEVGSLVVDAWVHEQDLRSVEGVRPDGRDHGAVDVTLGGFVDMGVGAACASGDCPPLRLIAEDFDTTVGEGEPAATVTAPSKWELSRGLGGRRSAAQVRAWDWQGDPEPYLAHLSPFGDLRETDLQE